MGYETSPDGVAGSIGRLFARSGIPVEFFAYPYL